MTCPTFYRSALEPMIFILLQSVRALDFAGEDAELKEKACVFWKTVVQWEKMNVIFLRRLYVGKEFLRSRLEKLSSEARV